ncbi:MAG: cob(I)yrinic acid a,c-diamide adenosyltransferase [Candidatus Nanoarchaeia archaeon]
MATKAYTRAGDGGESWLFGRKLPKTAFEFEALGVIDELNSILGFCRIVASKNTSDILKKIQHELFILGADIAKGTKMLSQKHVTEMEAIIDKINVTLPELKKFIIPGGTEASARLHIARTVARRAERRILMLKKIRKQFNPAIGPYINRLSSLLFVLARYENINAKAKEEFY